MSTGDYELNAAFSRDLRQVFFCKASPRFPFPNTWSVILESRWSDGRWTEPQVAAFSGTYSDIDPYFSPDFERIYYMSNRPRSGVVPEDFDLWYVARTDDGWSEPIHTGPAVNSEAMDGYPAIAEDAGNAITHRELLEVVRGPGNGLGDLYYVELAALREEWRP